MSTRVVPPRPSIRDEKEYSAQLSRMLTATIQAPLSRVLIKAVTIKDVLVGSNELAESVLAESVLGEQIAHDMFDGVSSRHTTKFKSKFALAVSEIGLKLQPVTVAAWLDEKTRENVRLIRGMHENQFSVFDKRINKLFELGAFDRQAVAQAAVEAFGVGTSRAKLIGRDQVSKATGELNQLRQVEVGVLQYQWLSAEDERVRPTHAENNRKIFEWGSPPATGHPGFEPNCRCVAVAVV